MGLRINNFDENLFYLNDLKFIKFPEQNGAVPMILSSYYTDWPFDDDCNNNFAKSGILQDLQRNLLSRIEAAIGADNLVEFETDLTALDGDDTYGVVKSKISLPTYDFYFKHKDIFRKCDSYFWWTATPIDTIGGGVRCIDPHGDGYDRPCHWLDGVRPIIMVKASVFNR